VRQMRNSWHTRPRVQRAPGIPCALYFEGEDKELAKLGRNRAARARTLVIPGRASGRQLPTEGASRNDEAPC
jgi:hypothetical protein